MRGTSVRAVGPGRDTWVAWTPQVCAVVSSGLGDMYPFFTVITPVDPVDNCHHPLSSRCFRHEQSVKRWKITRAGFVDERSVSDFCPQFGVVLHTLPVESRGHVGPTHPQGVRSQSPGPRAGVCGKPGTFQEHQCGRDERGRPGQPLFAAACLMRLVSSVTWL